MSAASPNKLHEMRKFESNNRREFSDAELDQLVWLAAELREFETCATTDDSLARALGNRLAAPAARRSIRVEPLRWFASVAAAAACGLIYLKTGAIDSQSSGRTAGAQAIPVRVSYTPDVSRGGGEQRHCVQSTPGESCAVLAVLRTWSSECQCLVWDLHRWDTGETIARSRAGESVDLVTNLRVNEPPPLDQVVLFAMARNRADLPAPGAESDRFLDCLLGASPASDIGVTSDNYAKTVRTCLPPTVTVVPQMLTRP